MNTAPCTLLTPPPRPAVILRPYQEACVRRAIAAYEQDRHGHELLVEPLAAGKTVIFSQVIAQLAGTYGLNALIVAHTDELLNQAAEKYRQVKPTAVIGKVGGGLAMIEQGYRCQVDTISRPPLRCQSHRHPHFEFSTWPIASIPKAATTCGRSRNPRCWRQPIRHALSSRNQRVVEVYREHACGRRAICFAVTVQHAHNLAHAFTAAGIPAAVVSGETPLCERKRLSTALRCGELKVLTNVQVLCEGFDEPLVDCVIMARPTQSRALYVQALGRGLRLAPVKRDGVILDLTDTCLKHRLEPQHLGKVLGKRVIDGETVLETIQREAQEKREREASGMQMIRRLKEKRTADLTINLKTRLDWQKHDDGTFELVIGQDKHRIPMVPSAALEGSYEVWAQLAPGFARQRWLADAPLGWTQEYAERQARRLSSHEHQVVLVDRHAGWRSLPVDPYGKQARLAQALRHSRLGDAHPRRGLRHPRP